MTPESPLGTASPAEPPVRSLTEARTLLERADRVAGELRALLGAEELLAESLRQSVVRAREAKTRARLSQVPIERIKDVTTGRVPVTSLQRSGLTTVAQVLQTSPERLVALPGVGPTTANRVVAAAAQLARAVSESMSYRIDLDPADLHNTQVLQYIFALETAQSAVRRHGGRARATLEELTTRRGQAALLGRPVRRLFSGKRRKAESAAALATIARSLDDAARAGVGLDAERVRRLLSEPITAAEVWTDFERRSTTYYGVLGHVVDLGPDLAATEGYLSTDVVERVNGQRLDESRLRVSLRGYQSFGARFALVQRRVILGDEMGLGKTIQALAAMAHLEATGASHFLVVAPASVLVNWSREISERSDLRVHVLHGGDRGRARSRWGEQGGVAVTTFDSLDGIAPPSDRPVDMLVVDEAHYVKNPHTKRSRVTARWTAHAERVLFLTGTPMENRVDEFRVLISYLQPEIAHQVDPGLGVGGAVAFRRAVAPVYLRRNQEDVLAELPELVQTDEWEEFGTPDGAAYRQAVREGNFMAMRRAAFTVPDRRYSAKLDRLVEIVDEAAANGHKVVIFSFFRDVLKAVAAALGDRAFVPLTGSVAAADRQRIVDAFAASPRPGALVCQIQAGGVGLNLQAASVVILCEPQVKPTLEAQAIARAHRMGQVRTVQVHRLLIDDSVDERMLEILRSKSRLFDAYARRSDLAAQAPEAMDVSDVELARVVVAQEQERLAEDLAREYDGVPPARSRE